MPAKNQYLFEDITTFEINSPKRYDLHLGTAKQVTLCTHDRNHIQITLASASLEARKDDFRVKIEETTDSMDIHIKRSSGISEDQAMKALEVFVQIPKDMIRSIELDAQADSVKLEDVECDSIELDVKTGEVLLKNTGSSVEIDCNQDMNIFCSPLNRMLALNQISASSRICIPEGTVFKAVTKGFKNNISYEKDGRSCEPFDVENAQNTIELNGLKSSLMICLLSRV